MGNRFYDGQPGPEIRRSLNELEAVFDEAILNAKGPQGWAPVLAGAIDGARRVHQVVDWTGGEGDKPTALGYIGAAGIVADIADAADVRGPQGAAGADGADGANGADGAQGPDGPQGQSGADGADGADGNDGWTAVLANVADGARIVQQVVDWVGGQGAKPATGKYVGPTGLVGTAAEAVNVRGPAGSGSGDVTGPASSTDGHVALFDGATGKALKGGGALGTAAAQSVEYFASAAEGALALTSLQPDDVAAVATSGAYADLSGRPTIPAAQQQTDWNAPSGVTAIANKPAVIAAGATQAAARTAIGAGTSNLADAPSDGKTYGRKDAGWVEAGGGIYKLPILSAAAVGKSPVSATEQLDFNCFYPTGLPGANSVVSCGGLFVACTAASSSPDFATSPDGKVWTLRTTADGNSKSIACDGIGVVVAKRTTSTGEIWVSANNGVTWAKKTNMPGSALNNSVPAIHNGIILIQASTAKTLYRSTDYGTTWTTVSVPFATADAYPIVAVAGRFVVPAFSGTYYSSSDGITWTGHPGLLVPYETTYSERKFYRFSTNTVGDTVIETTDGLNFSVVPSITLLALNDIPTKINGMNVGVVSGSTWHTSGPITRTLFNSPRNKNIATNGRLTVYGATSGVVVLDSTAMQTGWFGD